MTLSAIASLLIEYFLPEMCQKYLFLNYKQTSHYRSYKSFVPTFLHGRPRSVVLHCLERQTKSLKYTKDDVHDINEKEGVFNVTGSHGSCHVVSFGMNTSDMMPSCTCRDWTTWHIPCKHFFAVFRFHPEWNWNKLPQSYRDGAYLSTDSDSLNTFFDDTVRIEVPESFPEEPESTENENSQLEEPEPTESEKCPKDEIPKLQV